MKAGHCGPRPVGGNLSTGRRWVPTDSWLGSIIDEVNKDRLTDLLVSCAVLAMWGTSVPFACRSEPIQAERRCGCLYLKETDGLGGETKETRDK